MNTLRQALAEYLTMRRNLGFQLREAGKALLDFVTFMEQQHAPYITQALALAWAQQPVGTQPAYWAQRLSIVRGQPKCLVYLPCKQKPEHELKSALH